MNGFDSLYFFSCWEEEEKYKIRAQHIEILVAIELLAKSYWSYGFVCDLLLFTCVHWLWTLYIVCIFCIYIIYNAVLTSLLLHPCTFSFVDGVLSVAFSLFYFFIFQFFFLFILIFHCKRVHCSCLYLNECRYFFEW